MEGVESTGDITLTARQPRQVLHEKMQKLGTTIKFELLKAAGEGINSEFEMQFVLQDQVFIGKGRSKKLAMDNAAEQALLAVFKTKCVAGLVPAVPQPQAQKRKADSAGAGPGGPGLDHPSMMAKKAKLIGTKTALVHLNELKPGCQFNISQVEDSGSKVPVFQATVEVNDQTFEARGPSKKAAKQAAAEAALKSFVQFQDASEAHQALGRGFLPHNSDFTNDSNLDQSQTFNTFGSQNGSNGHGPNQAFGMTRTMKEIASGKLPQSRSPVQLLNEMHRDVKYDLTGETGVHQSKRYHFKATIGNREFTGDGSNKKLARNNAALNALKILHGIKHFAGRDMTAVNEDSVPGEGQQLANLVHDLVMKKFGELTDNFTSPLAKRKVLAGVVMTRGDDLDTATVLCVATGTKCINGEHLSSEGLSVNDCHAEVLCRRMMVRYLYAQLRLHLQPATAKDSVLERQRDGGFGMRPGIRLHMYTSVSPCKDMWLENKKNPNQKRAAKPVAAGSSEVAMDTSAAEEASGSAGDKHPNRKARGQLRTKIECGEGTIPVPLKGVTQTVDGVLQGERLLTMSCSDKISRWNVLGLQGSLLSHFLRPVYLSSVIAGSWYSSEHMARGLYQRVAHVSLDTPGYRVNKPFLSGITSPESRQAKKTPNHSINWCVGDSNMESVCPLTGRITDSEASSRLCKQALFAQFMSLYGRLPGLTQQRTKPGSYAEAKAAVDKHQKTKQAFIDAYSSGGLGHWVKKPQEQDDFALKDLFKV